MNSEKKDRIVFYSKDDLMSGRSLEKAGELLRNLNLENEFELNDLLEIFHVKKYFDNEMFLLSWEGSLKKEYIEKVDKVWGLIISIWNKFDDINILPKVYEIDFRYQRAFWEIINNLSVYKKINKGVFGSILDDFPYQINIILSFEKIVNFFPDEIKSFLLKHESSAELLLSEIEMADNNSKLFFPKCLTDLDKENIITAYLDSKEPNLNYIRLIEQSRDSDIKLSGKVRLKAKKKSKELNDKVFEDGHSWKIGIGVSIKGNQDEPVKIIHNSDGIEYSYSEAFLNDQKNNVSLFHLFKSLFGFVNKGLVTLVSKESELDTLEKIFMKSKNEYVIGGEFLKKQQLSIYQIFIFSHYLKQTGNSLENLIESVVKDFLNPELGLKNLKLNFPTSNSTYLERIRILAPEFEFLMKQYQTFVEEGEIDFELLEIDSKPLSILNIKSLIDKKYVYSKNELIETLKYYFFSDQSSLFYIEKYKEKYNNLWDLLNNENVELTDFSNYQVETIKQLILDEYLYKDLSGYVKIKNITFMFIIRELNNNEVLHYWSYSPNIRKELDDMINKGMIYFEETLFTRPEVKYFNYYLNKKEFTNGLDLRNKYLHGTNGSSENSHKQEYYILLKLMILVLLKIEEDVFVSELLKSSRNIIQPSRS